MRLGSLMVGGWLCAATLHAADWPQWRGPDRTGIVPASALVLTNLPANPKVLWRLDIGGGFSSPVVAGGKLVYLDTQNGQETAHLLDAATGNELWRTNYDTEFGDEWGTGPRSTPILHGDRLYVQSCRGEFRCLSLADGKAVWRVNFERDFGAVFIGKAANEGTASRRGNNGCGVVDGERVFAPVGSTNGASIVALDKSTGQILWKAGNDPMAHSSLMVATLAGTRQVVALTAEGLVGVRVEDGCELWRVLMQTVAKRHVVTPVIVGNDVIASSFTVGTICVRITQAGGEFKASPRWTNPELRVNLSTPTVVGNHLFTQGPMRQYVCVDIRTGKQAWTQPASAQSYTATIGLSNALLALTDLGQLRLIRADNRKYTELGRAQVCGETWSHPAYADGRLYVREGLTANWRLSCFELVP